jgi:phosphonate transport system ATP-binding protein
METGSNPTVELAGAGRAFGRLEALREVGFTIRSGERVVVIGPSGAGKSTLLRLVNTSLSPTSGSIRVLGEEPGGLSPRRLRSLRSRIGTVYQQLLLVPQASVLENVLMGRLGTRPALAVALATLRSRERDGVRAVLERVGIAPKLDERVDRLSGGEQQRVAVARVLYQEPDLIVADEPFASVDPRRSAEIIGLLVRAAEGRTLLLSTHQLEPALPHFPRVVGLRAGRILFDKAREDVSPEDLALLYQPDGATPSPEAARPFELVPRGPVPRSTLLVGASTTPGEYLLPRMLPDFVRAHSAVHLRLTVKDTAEVLADILAGRLELGFVGSRHEHPELHFEDFGEDEIVLVGAPGLEFLPPGPVAPSLMARLPRVDREAGSATRAVVEAQLEAMGLGLDPEAAELEAGSVEALKAAVSAGVGVGFASRLSVEADVAAGRLRIVPVEGLHVARRFFAVWRRGVELPLAARSFLAMARRAQTGGAAVA